MAYEFKATRRVEFADTDMAGIMHYSNFFRFMETVEHAFFRSLGFSIAPSQFPSAPAKVGWPRVHAECDFHKPLHFEDEVEIHMLITEKRSKSLSYLFKFRKMNGPHPIEVGRGKLTVVCVTRDGHGKMTSATIPAKIADKIEVAPADLLA